MFPTDIINVIIGYLNDLNTISILLCTCSYYYNIFGAKCTLKSKILTKVDLQNLVFGIDQLLLSNKDLVHDLNIADFTNVLIHYARESNKNMFEYCVSNASSENVEIMNFIIGKSSHYNKFDTMKCYQEYIDGNHSINSTPFFERGSIKHIGRNSIYLQAYIKMLIISCTTIDELFEVYLDSPYTNKCVHNLKLFQFYGANVCSTKLFGDTIGTGDTIIVRYLIKQGMDVQCVCNEEGDTAMNLACKRNSIQVTKMLLDAGASVNDHNIKNGIYPIHSIVGSNVGNKGIELVKYLVSNGADINVKDYDGNTLLHMAVKLMIESYSIELIELIKYLISETEQLNEQNIQGNTPLHLSVINNYLHITKILLQVGVDHSITNCEGKDH